MKDTPETKAQSGKRNDGGKPGLLVRVFMPPFFKKDWATAVSVILLSFWVAALYGVYQVISGTVYRTCGSL